MDFVLKIVTYSCGDIYYNYPDPDKPVEDFPDAYLREFNITETQHVSSYDFKRIKRRAKRNANGKFILDKDDEPIIDLISIPISKEKVINEKVKNWYREGFNHTEYSSKWDKTSTIFERKVARLFWVISINTVGELVKLLLGEDASVEVFQEDPVIYELLI